MQGKYSKNDSKAALDIRNGGEELCLRKTAIHLVAEGFSICRGGMLLFLVAPAGDAPRKEIVNMVWYSIIPTVKWLYFRSA